MFGFSFSELVVVIIVALVVMGPNDLPKMLRRLGQWAGKLRRAAADLRAQSGIDDALRSEGLADDLAEIRKLARGELDAVQRAARINDAPAPSTVTDPYGRGDDFYVVREREYPRDGADAYEALPDNAIVYVETLPKSDLARDPLYRVGDADAPLPPEPEPPPEDDGEAPMIEATVPADLPSDPSTTAASDVTAGSNVATDEPTKTHQEALDPLTEGRSEAPSSGETRTDEPTASDASDTQRQAT